MGLNRWLVAVSVGVLGYLAAWIAAYGLNLFDAHGAPIWILPPGAWRMRAIYLLIAVVAAVWVTATDRWSAKPLEAVIAAGVALGLVTVPFLLVSELHRHDFVRALPAGEDRGAALAAGHDACNWLAKKHWGPPPGDGRPSGSVSTAALRLQYSPPRSMTKGWHGAKSTSRLIVAYVKQVDARSPGPLTADETFHVKYTTLAFYALCPFQQWVHRPLGGSGD